MADTKTADAKSADIKPGDKALDPKASDPKASDAAKPADARPAPSADIQELAAAITRATAIRATGAAVATPDADKTVPGGKYLDVRTGKFVNCNGREIDEDGNILRPEELVMDPFGRLV